MDTVGGGSGCGVDAVLEPVGIVAVDFAGSFVVAAAFSGVADGVAVAVAAESAGYCWFGHHQPSHVFLLLFF